MWHLKELGELLSRKNKTVGLYYLFGWASEGVGNNQHVP
jgi:hypothetical protein